MGYSVPCWLQVSSTSWIIGLCSVSVSLSLSLSLQVCLFLPLSMSVYPCINSGSSFSLHCLSPCLSWFMLPSPSLRVYFSVSPSLSLSPLCFLSTQCFSLSVNLLPCVSPSIHHPPSLPSSLLCAFLSPDLGAFISAPSAWISLPCGFVSLHLPAPPAPPPRLPGNPPHHACLRIVTQRPCPIQRAGPLCSQLPPPTLPPPPHRPSGPAFPSFFPAQESWAISPAHDAEKCASAPGAPGHREAESGPPRRHHCGGREAP